MTSRVQHEESCATIHVNRMCDGEIAGVSSTCFVIANLCVTCCVLICDLEIEMSCAQKSSYKYI